jgi:hypothetical protein
MYQLRAGDEKILPEFLAKERKDFSLELRRILNRLRLVPLAGRVVIVIVEPDKKWRLAKLGAARGEAVSYFDERFFTSHKLAEWAALKMRWRQITGAEYPVELDPTSEN